MVMSYCGASKPKAYLNCFGVSFRILLNVHCENVCLLSDLTEGDGTRLVMLKVTNN